MRARARVPWCPQELRGAGVSCQGYHADMEPARRERVHLQWSQGRVQVIVATIAFGMGINNPHVRFVIHHTLRQGRPRAVAWPQQGSGPSR